MTPAAQGMPCVEPRSLIAGSQPILRFKRSDFKRFACYLATIPDRHERDHKFEWLRKVIEAP